MLPLKYGLVSSLLGITSWFVINLSFLLLARFDALYVSRIRELRIICGPLASDIINLSVGVVAFGENEDALTPLVTEIFF